MRCTDCDHIKIILKSGKALNKKELEQKNEKRKNKLKKKKTFIRF